MGTKEKEGAFFSHFFSWQDSSNHISEKNLTKNKKKNVAMKTTSLPINWYDLFFFFFVKKKKTIIVIVKKVGKQLAHFSNWHDHKTMLKM